MVFKKGQWDQHQGQALEAIVQMLWQYRGLKGDREAMVENLAANIDALNQFAPLSEAGKASWSRLSPPKADWFLVMHCLASLCYDHLEDHEEPGIDLFHAFMSAGEWACEELVRYDLIAPNDCGGSWTRAGRELLAGRYPS